MFDSYWEREAFQDIHSLKLTAISPLKIGKIPKRKRIFINFPGYSLVSGRVLLMDMPILQQLRCTNNVPSKYWGIWICPASYACYPRRVNLDLLEKMPRKSRNYSPRWWWKMVIHHGRIRKKSPKKQIQAGRATWVISHLQLGGHLG